MFHKAEGDTNDPNEIDTMLHNNFLVMTLEETSKMTPIRRKKIQSHLGHNHLDVFTTAGRSVKTNQVI